MWGLNGHGWTPYNVGLDCITNWWHADDLAAGAVTTWTDRISLNAPTQGTAGFRPVNTAASLNGKLSVVFDGVDDFLLLTAATGISTGNENVYALVSQEHPTGGGTIFGNGSAVAATSRWVRCVNNASNIRANVTVNSVNCTDLTATFSGIHVIQGVFTTTTEAGRINGADFSAGTTAAVAIPLTTRTTIGANTASVQFFVGKIRQIIITNGTESTLQRQKIEGYLANDGGISSLLTSSHPYFASAPS